jgi:hypothetical protein
MIRPAWNAADSLLKKSWAGHLLKNGEILSLMN